MGANSRPSGFARRDVFKSLKVTCSDYVFSPSEGSLVQDANRISVTTPGFAFPKENEVTSDEMMPKETSVSRHTTKRQIIFPTDGPHVLRIVPAYLSMLLPR